MKKKFLAILALCVFFGVQANPFRGRNRFGNKNCDCGKNKNKLLIFQKKTAKTLVIVESESFVFVFHSLKFILHCIKKIM